jgi:hypothetical protein
MLPSGFRLPLVPLQCPSRRPSSHLRTTEGTSASWRTSSSLRAPKQTHKQRLTLNTNHHTTTANTLHCQSKYQSVQTTRGRCSEARPGEGKHRGKTMKRRCADTIERTNNVHHLPAEATARCFRGSFHEKHDTRRAVAPTQLVNSNKSLHIQGRHCKL